MFNLSTHWYLGNRPQKSHTQVGHSAGNDGKGDMKLPSVAGQPGEHFLEFKFDREFQTC